jgi:plasmid stabilization system protein ParE
VKPALSIRPIARTEIQEAFRWYEKRRRGLGERFLQALRETLSTIEDNPQQYARIRGEIRRAAIQRFPYAILYLAEPDATVVLACFHSKRDPRRWYSRR